MYDHYSTDTLITMANETARQLDITEHGKYGDKLNAEFATIIKILKDGRGLEISLYVRYPTY